MLAARRKVASSIRRGATDQPASGSASDAATGDLIVSGEWQDAALHAFMDSPKVQRQRVGNPVAKVKAE
jgi:hypothetical protein